MSKTPQRAQSDPLGAVFFALSDANRRAMVAQLAQGPATAGELAAPFTMSKPAISRHLRVLETAGLVQRERRGRQHWFTLRSQPLDDAGSFLQQTRTFWERQMDQLVDYLETDDGR
ncbi:MAG: metalloregulator ArsR/SmtB family transcription factor [Myxococcales bacterium]|nr:metalloregulator ArsR/SmtB family transcription factor [Myxococcales bacterium]